MKIVFLVLIIIWFLPATHFGQDGPNAVPIIRMDKNRFAVGEAVFFWLEIKQTRDATIDEKYKASCRLTVIRPDGTKKIDNIGWPIDGPRDRGWSGGWGLGVEPVQVGKYTLVFEFAGQKSAPAYVFVEEISILKSIKLDFVFNESGNSPADLNIKMPTKQKVIFIVKNYSDQIVRFAGLGQAIRFELGSRVSVSMKRAGKYGADFFYPEDKIAQQQSLDGLTMYDKFTWDVIGKVMTITVKPGETYRHELSLQTVLDEADKNLPFERGSYSITFSTALDILIGEKNGMWEALSPFRVVGRSTANYVISRYTED